MSDEVETAHRAAHAKHGTTISVFIPPEASWDECEELSDAIANVVMGEYGSSADRVPVPPRGSWDVTVTGHRGPGCGWVGHPESPETDGG